MKNILIFILFLLGLGYSDIPERALSLDDVIDMSKNTLKYENIRLKELELQRTYDRKFYYYFPTVDLVTNYIHSVDSSYTYNNTSVDLSLDQNLIYNSRLAATITGDGVFEERSNISKTLSVSLLTDLHWKMKMMGEYDRYKRDYMVEKRLLNRNKNEFYLEVINKFYGLYRAINRYKIEEKGYDLSLKHYNEGKSKYQAGIIPEVEMLDLELYLQRKELSLKSSRNSLQYTKEDFNKYFNLPFDYEIRLEFKNSEITEYKINEKEDLITLLVSSPILLQYENNIMDSDDEISSVYRSKSVKGSLGLTYYAPGKESDYNPVFDTDNSTTTYSFGLTIPLFDKGELFNSLDIAKLQYKIANEEYNDKKQELENIFRDKLRTINLNYENLKISKKSFELSEKIYQISQKRFENGLITSKDFIQDQIDYINNRQSMINSEIDYILSVYDYKYFIGLDIF